MSTLLILPGLGSPPDAEAAVIPRSLAALLGRSRALATPEALLPTLWSSLGGEGEPPPLGYLSWCADHGEPPASPVMVATPVQLLPGPDSVRMAAVPDAGAGQHPMLWIQLSQAAQAAGGKLIAGRERAWLRAPDDAPLRGGAEPGVAGDRSVELPDDPWLRKLLNDVQMQLHAVPAAPFNSLWFHGGGAPPTELPDARGVTLLSEDPVLCALATLCGAATEIRSDGTGRTIVHDDRLLRASDPADWQDALSSLDEDLIGGALGPVDLIDPGRLHTRQGVSWWRRLFTRRPSVPELLGWSAPA